MYKKVMPGGLDALLEESLYSPLASRLDVPHQSEVQGKYFLSKAENNADVFLPSMYHLGIFGRSGCGKTNIILNLVAEISKDMRFWIYDTAKSSFRLLLRDSRIPNLLVIPWQETRENLMTPPPGLDRDSWRHGLAESLSKVFGGMSAQQSVLLQAIDELPEDATIVDLHFLLERKKRRASYTERIYLDRITNKTHEFTRGKLKDVVYNVKGHDKENLLLNYNIVYEYLGLAPEYIEFFLQFQLRWISEYKRLNRSFPHLTVIDEAWRVLARSEKENFVAQRTRILREHQEWLLYADQSALSLQPIVLNNSTKICLAQASGVEVDFLASHLCLNKSQASALMHLGVGEGIVKLYEGYTLPFLAVFQRYPYEGHVSNLEVESQMKDKWTSLEYTPKEEKASVAVDVNPNRKLWERFLISIIKEPLLNNTQRYEFLRISHSVGNRIKNALLELGFVKEHSLSSGIRGGSFKVLEILSNGCSFINEAEFKLEGKGSYEHKYFQILIAQEKKRNGCKAVIEMNLNGKAADIGVVEGSVLIAYELAFGNGEREIENIRKDLEAGYMRVTMICKNETIKRQLLKELPDELKGKVNVQLLSEAIGTLGDF